MIHSHPVDDGDAALVRARTISTARALVSREMSFLEGVRELAALGFDVSQDHHDPDFMLFVGIESQADHIPNTKVRALCAESWLAQCDKEASELERTYGQDVVAACNRLIERFSDGA